MAALDNLEDKQNVVIKLIGYTDDSPLGVGMCFVEFGDGPVAVEPSGYDRLSIFRPDCDGLNLPIPLDGFLQLRDVR